MFNAGSMLHCLTEANFRLFIVLSAVRRVLSNYLLTGSGESLIFQMALIHVDAREGIGDSSVRLQCFMHDQVEKLSSFGFKATFGV